MKRSILSFLAVSSLAAAQYCAVSTTNPCGGNEFISNVTFSSINNNSGCSATGFEDFTTANGGPAAASVDAGLSFTFTATIGSPFSASDVVSVWVDWDQNGTFDAGESTDFPAVIPTTTGTIAVPLTATGGITTMRVSMAWAVANPQPACGVIGFGEREDYSVDVQPVFTYCAVSTLNPCGGNEFISNVTFSTTNHTSGCSATGYEDFRTVFGGPVAAPVAAGTSFTFTATIGSPFNASDVVSVWVDWDQNGSFDAGESTDFPAVIPTTTGSIAVPLTATGGLTTMRVSMAWALANPQPACGAIGFGEREDYTVDVQSAFIMTATTGATVDIGATGGTPFAIYMMALTLNAGAYPNGYFYGLSIPFSELVLEFSAGAPFIGVLDGNGAYLFSVPTPGFGLPIYGVTVEFDGTLQVVDNTNVVTTLL